MGPETPHGGSPPHYPHSPQAESEHGNDEELPASPVKKRTGEEELPRAASSAEPAETASEELPVEALSDGKLISYLALQSSDAD